MSNEKTFKEIDSLLKEAQTLDKTIAKMGEESEKVREYCFEADKDANDTIEKVVDVVKSSPNLFGHVGGMNNTITIYGKDRGRGFYTPSFRLKVGDGKKPMHEIYEIHDENHLFYGTYLTTYNLARVAELHRTSASRGMDYWLKTKIECDETKKLCELIMSILKENIEIQVKKRRSKIEKGITASAQTYEKVV